MPQALMVEVVPGVMGQESGTVQGQEAEPKARRASLLTSYLA